MKKCADFEKIVYLSQAGESSAEEMAELQEHLEHCDSCAALRFGLLSVSRRLALLKQRPALINSEELLESTMAHIGREKRKATRAIVKPGLIRTLADALTEFFLSRRVRFGLSLLSFLLAGLFIVQEGSVLYQVTELEADMGRRGKQPTEVRSVNVRVANLASLRHLDELNSAIEKGILSVRRRGDEFRIDRELFAQFINRYRTQLTGISLKRRGFRAVSIEDTAGLDKLAEMIVRDYRDAFKAKRRLFGG